MMTRMGRMAAVVAAALILPACHDYHDDDPDVELSIVNGGSATVHVEVEFWDADDHEWETASFNVSGGGRMDLELYERYAEILVIRLPDGHVVYDEVLEYDDFGGDDATVTVFP